MRQEKEKYLVPEKSRAAVVLTQGPIQLLKGFFPREVDYSSSYIVEVQHEWSCSSTLPL